MSTKTLNINTNGLLRNYHSSMTNNNVREPTSPTFSVKSSYSWIAEKSSSEIKHILKSTFHSLYEKERDLKLAAEVGKTLLENNTLLEQKYHSLQTEFNTQQQQTTKHYQHRLASNENTITSLETEHAELLKKYEATLESKEKISRQNISSQQKLTCQVNELYQSLEQAYEKIQEQEAYRENYLKKMIIKEEKASHQSSAVNVDHNDNSNYVELSNKIEHMMDQNQQLFKVKDEIQHQFMEAIVELKELQCQFNQVYQTKEQFQLLENKFQYQENHIYQLTSLIEEYRLNLTSDMMPGLLTSSHSASSSDEDEDEFDALPQHVKGATTSLFSELQLANSKQEQQHLDLRIIGQDNNMMIEPSPKRKTRRRKSSSDRNLVVARREQQVMYPSLKADDSLIAPMAIFRNTTYKYNKGMVPHKSKGLFNRMMQIPFDSFYFIWRFFRFFIVVQMAMIIHLFSKK